MRTKKQITGFIEINHHLMTAQEMADELGVPLDKVRKTCSYRGWTAFSQIERNHEVKEAETPMEEKNIPGLKEIAAQVVEGMTGEEKKWFYENCMEKPEN
jgi:hypothetical protein